MEQLSDDEDEIIYSEVKATKLYEVNDVKSDVINHDTEKRKSMLHNGQWMPKEYKVGRLVKYTGIWTCCGGNEHYSLYCKSIEARISFQQELNDFENEKKKAAEYAHYVKVNIREPWEKNEGIIQSIDIEDPELRLIREANSVDNSYNVLMLVSWIYKHRTDEKVVLKGLKLMNAHAKTGDGCIQIVKHRGLLCVTSCQKLYHSNKEVQLLCIQIMRQLVDCNFTRDGIIGDMSVLHIAFSIGHNNMGSLPHLVHALHCVLQCSRSERGRADILNRHYIQYCILFCKKNSACADVLRPVLKLFNWMSSSDERLVLMYEMGGGSTSLKCMERHMNNSDILSPAMLFLTRVAAIHPPALTYLVRKKAVPVVIGALRALYSDELLQIEGLKMLKALSLSPEGWRQISDTRGGWLSMCEGTTIGNALIHDAPGHFHNPGWAIGETPHLPKVARITLEAAKAAASKSAIVPKGDWTAHSLRQFMGLSMKPQRLAINTQEHEEYFELLKTLDLLPTPGEEREYWHIRLTEYEKENDILISDMVQTVMEMKAREKRNQSHSSKLSEEYVKPVYVMGNLISTKALEEADVAVTSQLEGVI